MAKAVTPIFWNFQKWGVTQNGGGERVVFEMGGLNPSTNYDKWVKGIHYKFCWIRTGNTLLFLK